MALETDVLKSISDAVTQQLQKMIPQVVQAVMIKIEEKVTSLTAETEALKTRMFSIRDDVHNLMEGQEIQTNKKLFSDIIIYGARELKNPSGGEDEKKTATQLILSLKSELNISKEIQNVEGDLVLMAKRLNTDPKVGAARPLVVTLASDELRVALIRKGNKYFREKAQGNEPQAYRFKDNVCRETRVKRRVLGCIAGALRTKQSTAVVPFDVRAKLLVAEEKGKKKFVKYSYAEAVRTFGDLVDENLMESIKKAEKQIRIEQVLLL